MTKILIKRLSKQVSLPKYETSGSSGMDLSANIDAKINIEPGKTAIIPTGLAFSLRQVLIRSAGTTFMMQVAYLIPVFGIFYGWALMNEPLKFSLLIGVILVVIGIAISRLQVETNSGI